MPTDAQLYSVTSAHGGMVIPRTRQQSALSDPKPTYWMARLFWNMQAMRGKMDVPGVRDV